MSEMRPEVAMPTPAESGLRIPATTNGAIALPNGLQRLLSENLGRFVVCEFLAGTDAKEVRSGILYYVGEGYLILYDDVDENYMACDTQPLFSVTFTTPEQQLAEEPGVVPESELSQPQAQNNLQENMSAPLPPLNGIQAVSASNQTKAAFNYAKRRARR